MKKALAILSAALLCCGLTACSGVSQRAPLAQFPLTQQEAQKFNNVIAAGNNCSYGLKTNGKVVSTLPSIIYENAESPKWEDMAAISAYDECLVGLKSDKSTVYMLSSYSCSFEEFNWDNIVRLNAGYEISFGIQENGSIIQHCNLDELRHLKDAAVEWQNIVSVVRRYSIETSMMSSYDAHYTLGLTADGTVLKSGIIYEDVPSECENWTDIVAIDGGTGFVIGLKSDGTVVANGYNKDGQCDVSEWTNIVAIAAGDDFSVGLQADGTVVATGKNKYGECDVSDWTDIVAIAAGINHTLGLKADGTVVAVGDSDSDCCKVSKWKNIGPRQL